ncbi:MAG: DUF927 domain-containing protein [Xanthobacteraceae bacterium]|jgi:hypothetical protein
MTTATANTIRKLARIHDKATDKYLEVIDFPVSEIQNNRLELLPSEVSDPTVFARKLRDAGAILEKDKARLKEQLERVARTDPPEEWVYEDHTGWIEGGKAFILTNGVIGDLKSNIVGVNQWQDLKDPSGKLSISGGWKPWRDAVADTAKNSTTMMLCISAALGAPLLTFAGIQPFCLNLFGPTRAGKSVATVAASSVIGIGREKDLISWKLTDARLEQRLPEFNDAVFPIDDLDKMKGKEKDKYQRLRDLSYGISHGFGTARHSQWVTAQNALPKSWSSIVLTSWQFSVRQLASKLKIEREPGEALRLIDVPAVFEGQDHIFDRLPSDVSNVEDWKSRMFAAIAKGCEENHGKAFRKYIKSLIARQATLKGDTVNTANAFVSAACDKFDGAIARDVARKFGVIYAGGLFGIQSGLLPWTEAELRDAILKSFLGARELLPDSGVLLRSGISMLTTVRRQLPKVSTPLKKCDKNRDYKKLIGYRFSTAEENRYRFRYEHYCRMFVSGEQRHQITNRLIEKNHITLATPKKGTERRPQEQFIWPDGSRPRSIELVFKKKKPSPDPKGPHLKKRE